MTSVPWVNFNVEKERVRKGSDSLRYYCQDFSGQQTFPYFKLLVCSDKDPSENTCCTSAYEKKPCFRAFPVLPTQLYLTAVELFLHSCEIKPGVGTIKNKAIGFMYTLPCQGCMFTGKTCVLTTVMNGTFWLSKIIW